MKDERRLADEDDVTAAGIRDDEAPSERTPPKPTKKAPQKKGGKAAKKTPAAKKGKRK